MSDGVRDDHEKEIPDALGDLVEELSEELPEMKEIEFPITVNEIELGRNVLHESLGGGNEGKLVKIRPCSEEDNPDDETFLGIHLGQMQVGLHVMFDEGAGELELIPHLNPAIFVPDLGRVVWGYESWWGVIESEEEFREITDDDIDNVWYVRALKDQLEEDDGQPEV